MTDFKDEMRRSVILSLKLFFAPIYGTYLVFKEVNAELNALDAEDGHGSIEGGAEVMPTPNDLPQDWGDDDVCNHCGATWDESVHCVMNGCPFGRIEDGHGSIEEDGKQ